MPSARRLTVLDLVILIGAAAVGFGLQIAVEKAWFQGWYRLAFAGAEVTGRVPKSQYVVYLLTDISSWVISVPALWTPALVALRLRRPIPRRAWDAPGMAGIVAALVGWVWALFGLAIAVGLRQGLGNPSPAHFESWVVEFFVNGRVFPVVGGCVAAVWFVYLINGRWRRGGADWLELVSRVVCVMWMLIGIIWGLRAVVDLI